jgi:hypothetical protein
LQSLLNRLRVAFRRLPVRLTAGLAFILSSPLPLYAGSDPGDRFTEAFAVPYSLFRQWFRDDPAHVVRDHLVSISSDAASITFDYEDGGSLDIQLRDGALQVDDRVLGRYPVGGALEAAWRQFILDAARRETAEVLTLARSWQPDGLSREELGLVSLIHARLGDLSAAGRAPVLPRAVPPADPNGLTIDLADLSDPTRLEPLLRRAARLDGAALRVTVPGGQARAGNYSVGSGESVTGPLLVIRGDADVYGTVEGNLATVDGNVTVYPGAVVTGDVLAVTGDVRDKGGEIRGEIRTLRTSSAPVHRSIAPQPRSGSAIGRSARNAAGLFGVFLTLLFVGTGLVMFARQPLEVVSDTIAHSFGRAFLVGLLGQILLLPTFGMLVVGLILSVAGILLLPFAVIVYSLLVVVAILGGFLAVAHAMGERYTRRQLAMGAAITSANSYRYVAVGLIGITALWAVWVLFGWVPVAGTLVFSTALLVTWLLATVGFGAALLSRAGFREEFAGRLLPAEALTDEYLWATPQFGVPAQKRPGSRTPPPLR